jgi:predicted ATPase
VSRAMPTIRTPDQRIRVFVSSTLEELAQEREAARRAVESMRLSPVLFELGARPHPPRQLYRAYLDQSEVFVGIYWQRYGWIAPGMEVSGLEDELQLARDKPKLLYVKGPAPDREERLSALLKKIADEGRVSYRHFSDAEELEGLLEDDLALLLSEHFFTATEAEPSSAPEQRKGPLALPRTTNSFVGRKRDVEALQALLDEGEARLITLTGPAGVGKTRLALEVAERCHETFAEGTAFVPLGAVSRPELVIPTIVQALDVPGSGTDELELLIEYLRSRDLLVILDNFEQVISVAPQIARIIESCPSLTILITSRAVLNVRSESEFPVLPLEIPDRSHDTAALRETDAVKLFVERARAVDPGFALDEGSTLAVAEICRRLDGVPLAVELAAARVRLLSPQAILARLDSSLQLLTGGPRDSPARHQTLRAAIDWSYSLLDEQEQSFFARFGSFSGGWTFEAAEDVANAGGEFDALELLTSLLEKSLVKLEEAAREPRFSMLQTVRQYAAERLAGSSEAAEIEAAHANYYLRLIEASYQGLRSSSQKAWMEKLESDNENLRAALRHCLDHGEGKRVAEAGWTLWLFWWINGHLQEGRDLMEEVLRGHELTEWTRARALAVNGVMAFWQTDYLQGLPLIHEALDLMRAQDDRAGVALCQLPLGFVEAGSGDSARSQERYLESIRYFKETNDEWGATIALNAFTWMTLGAEIDVGPLPFEEAVALSKRLGTRFEYGMALRNHGNYLARYGDRATAKSRLAEALRVLWHGSARGGSSYTIDAIAEIAADEGAPEVAAHLFAAVEAIRESIGSSVMGMFVPRLAAYKVRLRDTLGADRFEEEWAEGRTLSMDQVAELALAWAEGSK